MSIEVKKVTKLYGEQKALNEVSFSVKPGEIVGFLGPNGAGKSTMMKIITCFIPQTKGKVEVCGFDVEKESMNVRKNVGYLPENNPLYLDMYVKEYLEFIAGLHKVDNVKGRIREMIETVGLEVEQNKKVGELSKGYRQRVGLAQALIHDPRVLILDEPTTGLDPNQLTEIRGLIKDISKEKTIMLSTHIMQEVEAICDRVIIVNKGKIVADEKAEKMRDLSGDQTVIRVEFDKEVSKDMLLSIEGVETAENVAGNTWKIASKDQKDVRNNVFQFAVQNDLSVLTMQKEALKMEDVFKQLTTAAK